jgi:hypothetical protein
MSAGLSFKCVPFSRILTDCIFDQWTVILVILVSCQCQKCAKNIYHFHKPCIQPFPYHEHRMSQFSQLSGAEHFVFAVYRGKHILYFKFVAELNCHSFSTELL